VVSPVSPPRRSGDWDHALATSPRMISYRSMTAATPMRVLPSSMRRSTRTTLPRARTNTSVPWVISAGKVIVISNSEPASRFCSTTKYNRAWKRLASCLAVYLIPAPLEPG